MGKHWKQDSSSYSDKNQLSYNAVHYVYKDKVSFKRKHSPFDTKNSVKFREVLKQSRISAAKDSTEENCDSKTVDSLVEERDLDEKECTENEQETSGQTLKKARKKKKRKEITEMGESNKYVSKSETSVATSIDTSNEKCAKKRKEHSGKKMKEFVHAVECGAIEKTEVAEGSLEKKCHKKKKRRHSEGSLLKESQDIDSEAELKDDSCGPPEDKKRKKKDKKRKQVVNCVEIEDMEQPDSNEVKSLKKRKNKEKTADDQQQWNEVKSAKSKKKKSQKRKGKGESGDTVVADDSDVVLIETQSHLSPDVSKSLVKGLDKKKKERGQKTKIKDENSSDRCNTEESAEYRVSDSDKTVSNTKKKKKKNRDKNSNRESGMQNANEMNASSSDKVFSDSGSKSKKKSKNKDAVKVASLPKHSSSKKRKRMARSDSEGGVVTEEGTKAKRDGQVTKGSSITAGQWGTAEFADSARQGKFLRLMGGMKTSGGQQTTENYSGKKTLAAVNRVNTALTHEEESTLNKGLEKQYETALNWMIDKKKGCGLGFEKDPAEGKKFHINVNKSVSKKFED